MEDNTELGKTTSAILAELCLHFDLRDTAAYNRAYGIVRKWLESGDDYKAETMIALLVKNGFEVLEKRILTAAKILELKKAKAVSPSYAEKLSYAQRRLERKLKGPWGKKYF